MAIRLSGRNLQGSLPHGTVDDRIRTYGPQVHIRLKPHFDAAGVTFPPRRTLFLGLKDERLLEIYAASDDTSGWRRIRTYPVLAASGNPGPKLKEGDSQVPEGVYGIESLNPNSRFHLSIRLNYPNDFDRQQARLDNRTNLGGDIMIHGDAVSIGCLAMGDPASEDLFVLAEITGIANVTVLLSPVDFRKRNYVPDESPSWVHGLYDELRARLSGLPLE
ncbi:MAG: L,D-transpeptidase family protein [Polyangiaceae bacterium]|nr:L,D-transpeptidase family protein [Polyangiaceae bacterium]